MSNEVLTPETLSVLFQRLLSGLAPDGDAAKTINAEGFAHVAAWETQERRLETLTAALAAAPSVPSDAKVEENIRLSHQKAMNDAIWNRGT